MNRKYYLLFILITNSWISLGQRLNVNNELINVINDLSSSLRIENERYVVSPFIAGEIDLSELNTKELVAKYGFDFKNQENTKLDTLLLASNRFFSVLNPDSLLKYQRLNFNNTILDFDPKLQFIEKQYHRIGIIYFKKVILSKKKGYALVEYWMYCGNLCGYGETIVMKKINNKWEKFDVLISIVS